MNRQLILNFLEIDVVVKIGTAVEQSFGLLMERIRPRGKH